ncbi:DNA gyrase subunit A [Chitinimonas sp. BJB300]|uniref:DNA gyrase subunit A n=1 Tax=Chitinimonas sp. BJB300 TaxID=1559339 RepID=UPI000C0C900D|nr:DNA gyrase subunit A [Chitinimonas sp. BJB300]PHV11021.1 DNA gyrase subunit A [Chitinimonas sp. BJB300]TSJ86053.1 DNA gyrase subunit A [Chitinimonas sp. BJB300]
MTDLQQFAKETIPVSLEEEMRRSYLDYAMSVIVGRALPDVRDGLKPVHRRVLFAMQEANNVWNRPYVKCARIVGDVMGKYHPHGDSAIYDTLVRMAQDFSLRYTLVDGQGNFGSIDGDNAAAMRYTECRMEKISVELMADIDKETVDFVPNYDGKELEPSVLPTKLPNLLVNGSTGIAVGMATNIPPHNLGEVINGALALLANSELSIDELIDLIPAPDFPTAGIIYGIAGVREGYRTGRGRVVMRARTHIEEVSRDKQAIIVDELPYQVNKKILIEKIADLVRNKQIEGIADLRDESDKSGMRIYIELKRSELPEVVLNHLYKQTELQSSFGMNMVALVDGQPRLLNLKQILEAFLRHRREVVTRRTVFELKKARDRAHTLEGLAVALSNVDEVIALIKAAATPPEAKVALMSREWRSTLVEELLNRVASHQARPEWLATEFGLKTNGYRLSDAQAQAILDMRLQRLTGLEQDKLEAEYREIMDKIVDLLDILARSERITEIIVTELNELKIQFGDGRKSEIVPFGEDISLEDLITPQEMVVTLSHTGYMKAQPLDEYRAQKRGGRGKQATATKDDDFIDNLFVANTHDYVLCFSSLGRVYWMKVYEVPQGGRASRGRPIVNLLPLQEGERINAILPVKAFTDDHFVFMATQRGTVKKTPLSAFSNPRKLGIIAVALDEGDQLVGVAITSGNHQVMLFSSGGKAVRFDENDVRPMGRDTRGVRGMTLAEGHDVISLLVADSEDWQVLTASDGGYGKRTQIAEFRHTSRGTQGVIAMELTEKTGFNLVAASLVTEIDGLMLITTGGVLIRTTVKEVRETGRSAQGVRLINLDAGETLSGIVKVADTDEEEIEELDGVEELGDAAGEEGTAEGA